MSFDVPSLVRGLAPWAMAGLLATAALGVHAQSVSTGQTLYTKVFVSGTSSCAASACHGTNPASNINNVRFGYAAALTKSAVSGRREMQFLQSQLSDSDYNDLAAYIASKTGDTPSYITVAATPAVTLSGSTLAFGSVTVGQTSTARSVTLSNSGSAALTINGIAASGTGFAATNNCPTSLAAGSSCTISVTFTPTSAASVTGSVAITSNASGSPHGIGLSGTGTATPVANLAWTGSTSLSFSATVGTPSAEQTLTLLNSGSVAGTIGAVTVSGTNAADFVHGGSCGAGVTLSAGASCTVTVGFDPAAAGARSATLQVTSTNAANPATISLAGTAGGSGATSNANVGGGGCSVAASGRPFDPLLLALGGLAVLVLGWRRWRQHAEDQDQVPGRNP
ncbi:choice-of-anchor D domain-containing protein [Sphaerotilus microaerophilus]|uniref:Choice-of-anchor D domain-containing protein n=1 Tax=Sphaerotilus microaerophilus TaxID=2914710 RepID=A0ABM7YPI8_9BURK|nr:choice-of-anchor D domain-containing protein [Sphaerotilus sp. FB-5]BDI06434.1 hypothetical protein CATMQ487_34040 [Sphaerotilus sp. FB-5]